MITALNILKALGMNPKNTEVAIQGMGNVGSVSAKLLFEEGLKIVAVSDVSCALYNPDGLDIPSILEYLSQKRGNLLEGYHADNVVRLCNAELLELDVDVLIPAALENQINTSNADKIRARVIVEAANGPTTIDADKILDKKGIVVVPDILSNAGGVVVSYFEWVQNIQSISWSEKHVNGELKQIMDQAFQSVWNIAREKKVSLRTGAYLISVKRVIDAKNMRGIWP